jgi:hypothetical protein
MTLTEARKILKPPLIFGNDAQIKAARFIEQVEECKEAILACDYVDEHLACNLSALLDCDCIEKWYDEDKPNICIEALKEAKKK